MNSRIYLFYHDEVKNMTEMKVLVPGDVMKNLAHAAEDLGIDDLVKEIGIDKVIAAVGIDKVIAAVGIDKVIAAVGIERIADNLDTSTLEKILAKRKRKSKTNT
jgi:hypothetical protein